MEPQSTQVKKIPLVLVDDPPEAIRTHMSAEALNDLVDSIRTNGLIQPIVVKEKNGRYEVVVGHRRLQAHRMLELAEIEAIIKDYTEPQAESAKLHENLFREEVNPVDEAIFLARYIKKTGVTVEEIAHLLNRGPVWVASRLEILNYPDYLISEVHDGKIPLGVALALSQIPDEKIKKEYTRFAVLQGINVITAKRWLASAKVGTLPENPASLPEGQDYYATPVSGFVGKCVICGEEDQMVNMENDLVHVACRGQMATARNNAKQREPQSTTGHVPGP